MLALTSCETILTMCNVILYRSPTGGKAYGMLKKACSLEVVRPTILPYLELTVIPPTTSDTMLIHTKSNKSQQTIYCKY